MDEQEYKSCIMECTPSMYHVARSILLNDQDCADAVQEAVFRGWQRRHQLRDPEAFRPWMMRITVNECRNLQRRMLRQSRVTEACTVQARLAEAEHPPQDKNEALWYALCQLPERERVPLVLYYVEGYATREIAKMLDESDAHIRERMRTARKKLGRLLTDENG